ncbi:MAG TPA: phosphoenolpyruvate carboxylase, partial [Acidimicrobiales bacterium]|nr:phosphoenolpyruvate carboxylase [Acidimicrobiales bacterium]
MTAAARDSALRADIRLLGGLLGETLARHEGQGMLDLVERVRALSKSTRASASPSAGQDLARLLSGLDLRTATLLVRAFSAYFHLANIAEQVHRADERSFQGGDRSRLAEAVDGLRQAGVAPSEVADLLARLELRLVFTAHPTEAVRRSILTKRGRIARLLEERHDRRASEADARRTERALAEAVDLIWETDELRRERPTPVDEARSVVFYLQELFGGAVPDVLDELVEQLGRLGVEVPVRARPLRFGTWVGGDRDGNPAVTPEVTMEVLRLQRDVVLGHLAGVVERLITALSTSTRIVAVSPDLEKSLAADRELLPEVHARYHALNAEEPYRLKCSYIHARLLNARRRLADGGSPRPGIDYGSTDQLLDDLEVVRSSLLENSGELIARGMVDRAVRAAAASGLSLATMDVREHADRHHEALATLHDSPGGGGVPYRALDRSGRRHFLGAELGSQCPPRPPPTGP